MESVLVLWAVISSVYFLLVTLNIFLSFRRVGFALFDCAVEAIRWPFALLVPIQFVEKGTTDE